MDRGNAKLTIEGKVALITGAARGIGQEFARSLGSAGAAVVAADINDCAATLDLVNQKGGEDSPVVRGRACPVGLQPTDLIRGHPRLAARFASLRGCPAQEPVLGPRI
jgi:NAD(P)-dependent dehydrogenase (short-subunit alcohol dehydrogenase family)